MRSPITTILLILAAGFHTVAFAQAEAQGQALTDDLAGRKFSVSYRQGGPVYGTYFFLTVNLCRSGNYVTLGQSRKQSASDSHGEQVHHGQDQGHWNVTAIGGQLGIQ